MSSLHIGPVCLSDKYLTKMGKKNWNDSAGKSSLKIPLWQSQIFLSWPGFIALPARACFPRIFIYMALIGQQTTKQVESVRALISAGAQTHYPHKSSWAADPWPGIRTHSETHGHTHTHRNQQPPQPETCLKHREHKNKSMNSMKKSKEKLLNRKTIKMIIMNMTVATVTFNILTHCHEVLAHIRPTELLAGCRLTHWFSSSQTHWSWHLRDNQALLMIPPMRLFVWELSGLTGTTHTCTTQEKQTRPLKETLEEVRGPAASRRPRCKLPVHMAARQREAKSSAFLWTATTLPALMPWWLAPQAH